MKRFSYLIFTLPTVIVFSCNSGTEQKEKDKEASSSDTIETPKLENKEASQDLQLPEGQVKIGSQIWMSSNLNVDKFRNGDPILEAKTPEEWKNAGKNKQAAWCNYENDAANGDKYGKLYNWYAVNDPRGLAPEGWRVPKQNEWKTMVNELGGKKVAGAKMKSKNGWKDGGNGSDESGFSSLPGGNRKQDGSFQKIGVYSGWWSATGYKKSFAGLYRVTSENGQVFVRDDSQRERGFSVRCVKD
jgi:uncharacterized protein (TIGR02145 family)